MAEKLPQYIRQFNGCCVLIQMQLARVGETYDVRENCRRAMAAGKLKQDDVDFIMSFLDMKARLDAGESLDEVEVRAAVPRIQMIVASNLNCADSA